MTVQTVSVQGATVQSASVQGMDPQMVSVDGSSTQSVTVTTSDATTLRMAESFATSAVAAEATNRAAAITALSGIYVPLARQEAQAARSPAVARVLDKFLAGGGTGLACGLVGTTYSLYRGVAPGLFAKYDLVLDSSEPGNYPLHQLQALSVIAPMQSLGYDDVSVTSTGTWTLGANAGAFNGKYTYSTAAGTSKTFTSPAGVTALGVRLPQLTNGGLYFLVSIDGDTTRADACPTAQGEVTAGRLASSVLIANGGTLNPTDRVFNSYSPTSGASTYDERIGLASGLSPAAHTVALTNTGYAVGGLASQRAYLSGFAYATSSSQPADAGAVQISVATLCNVGSAWEHALQVLPVGATTPTFVGNIHGYEVEDAFAVSIDGAAANLTDGQIVAAAMDVSITRTGHLLHPDTGSMVVADTLVVYTMGRYGLTVDDTITPSANAGTLSRAYAMMPLSGALATTAVPFTGAGLLDYPGGPLTFTGSNGDSYYGSSKSAAAWAWGGDWGALMFMPTIESYNNDWTLAYPFTRWEDRNGTVTKVYMPRNWGVGASESFPPLHSVAIYTVGYFSGGAEATLAPL